MQTLIIPKLNQVVASAINIPAVLSAAGISYTSISNVNWPNEFPYKPKVEFAAAHTGDALLLHYRVEEQSVRAVAEKDHEHIWEDACVEFFVMPVEADELYYNIECNCTGKLIVAVGEGRDGRKPAPAEVMRKIDRWASLGTEPFDVRNEPTKWEVALRVPITTFFKHKFESFEGLVAKGNVYKCGDNLPVPHFISWSPIKTENPDFHRPEFFGQMIF
ncbi:MAG: hypothetical protein IKW91_08270 [Bacteroidaceae bacterium]|jgi:hypothetical protein|nr:hypothetical protein [Bacteroidaceae bacterium]